MTKAQKPERMRIEEDGELPDLDSLLNDQAPARQEEPVYCTHCGTANIPHATYCRKCGQALALQEMHAPPRAAAAAAPQDAPDIAPKRKNDAFRERVVLQAGAPASASQINNFWAMVLRASTMLWIAGMVISALIAVGGASAWVTIPIALMWIVVEATRSSKMNRLSVWDVASMNITMILVTAIVTTSLFVAGGASAWVSVPVLLLWAGVEAIRHG